MKVENCEIYRRLFSTYIFSGDIIPEMLKLCRVTKLKVFFPVLVYVFNFDLFEFSAAILEKGLLKCPSTNRAMASSNCLRRLWRAPPARVHLINDKPTHWALHVKQRTIEWT